MLSIPVQVLAEGHAPTCFVCVAAPALSRSMGETLATAGWLARYSDGEDYFTAEIDRGGVDCVVLDFASASFARIFGEAVARRSRVSLAIVVVAESLDIRE